MTDPASVGPLIADGPDPVAVYLALPPRLYEAVVTTLATVGLPEASRIVLENPFGEDLDSAVSLNRLLARAVGTAEERSVYRVDHVLGMTTCQNLLTLRLANRILEPVWNSTHVEQVEIWWEEDLGLEGRAGYFDRSGTLRDVLQNHMLQVFSLLTMDLPATTGERDIRDRKVAALRSVRRLSSGEAASRSRRARYTAGRLADSATGAGRSVPAYEDEDGVDPARGTETFAEIVLELDSERWAGTHFLLRAGKALRSRRKEVVVRFRPVQRRALGEHNVAGDGEGEGEGEGEGIIANELRIGIDGPEDLALHLTGGVLLDPPHPAPLVLTAPPPAAELPTYGRVLLDILTGESSLSVRADEAEEAWRVVTPVLESWADGLVPMLEYPAGSAGPP